VCRRGSRSDIRALCTSRPRGSDHRVEHLESTVLDADARRTRGSSSCFCHDRHACDRARSIPRSPRATISRPRPSRSLRQVTPLRLLHLGASEEAACGATNSTSSAAGRTDSATMSTPIDSPGGAARGLLAQCRQRHQPGPDVQALSRATAAADLYLDARPASAPARLTRAAARIRRRRDTGSSPSRSTSGSLPRRRSCACESTAASSLPS